MFQKKFVEKIHIFYVQKLLSENLAVYELLWKKYHRDGQATDGNIIRPKAIDTHSEYVIPLAFPRQHWSCERASMFRLYVD